MNTALTVSQQLSHDLATANEHSEIDSEFELTFIPSSFFPSLPFLNLKSPPLTFAKRRLLFFRVVVNPEYNVTMIEHHKILFNDAKLLVTRAKEASAVADKRVRSLFSFSPPPTPLTFQKCLATLLDADL